MELPIFFNDFINHMVSTPLGLGTCTGFSLQADTKVFMCIVRLSDTSRCPIPGFNSVAFHLSEVKLAELDSSLSVSSLKMLLDLHAETTQGVWGSGKHSLFITVNGGEDESDVLVAKFSRKEDAAFCDAAHEMVPLLVRELLAHRTTKGGV